MTKNVTDLIERLEKATGPGRELDARIAVACLPQRQDPERYNHARLPVFVADAVAGQFEWVEISGISLRTALTYTSSIDAALTLATTASQKRVMIFAMVEAIEAGADILDTFAWLKPGIIAALRALEAKKEDHP